MRVSVHEPIRDGHTVREPSDADLEGMLRSLTAG